jgi:DNA-binding MarR family transcriptional regulator
MLSDCMTLVRTLARLCRLLENSDAGLTLPQYRLLALVAEGDERAGSLAGRLSLSKPTVTAAVDGLVERGLVVRAVVAGDRRAVRIAITQRGIDALEAAESAMRARLQPVLDRCADEMAVLAAFDQLQQALDQALHHGVSKAASR